MRIEIVVGVCGGLVAILACGGSGTSSDAASRAAIARYQDLSAHVASAAAAYDGAMAAPGMTTSGCAAVHDAYDAQVRAWMTEMVHMSGSMDAFMDAHGGRSYADMACVASAMMDELDAHRAVACTYGTVGEDRVEASRHAGVMGSYAAHEEDRCTSMMGALDGHHGMMWEPVAAGCVTP